MTVERDIRAAPTDIGKINPTEAKTPAAKGTEIKL
jgi:hypothetical protein